MLDATTFKMRLDAVPAVFPQDNEEIPGGKNREGQDVVINRPKPRHQKKDLKPARVLCASGKFAVAELENGWFVALWPGHADVAETREELMGLLNAVERQAFDLGVNKAD